ncbi:glycosyltransferase family 2 protein [Qipengyuania qiaonensis]|uniref:Glycosyltransferase family 2 protein n=1 Tax=Qipengyuania qiaonensis TaxID=2867240 RepID=A0ABS7JBE7_9SPHN|nr:glycosyltransferase family 2 protein [Qipengyuania qiaonensis]MBX7483646.1 glycosyltransferase family 2 protein [Qipengyuania qiaonensis]
MPLSDRDMPDKVAQPIASVSRQPLDKVADARPVDRLTLAVFEAEGLPVGRQWVAPGEVPRPDEATIARATRKTPEFAEFDERKISVVICTRDRPEDLSRCLAGFAAQSRAPDELVVVDNASASSAIRSIAEAHGARYLREDREGLDFARNTGALAATGDLILYTDDDTELHPDWIANLSAAFVEPHVMGVTGLVLPARLDTEAQLLFEQAWGFGRGFDRVDFGPAFWERTRRRGCPAWEIGAGASMGFRREVFEIVGYFDERLGAGQSGCSDDSEFWYRILAAGFTCRYEPRAVIWHHHRLKMEGLSSQIYQYMRGHTAALLMQFDRSGEIGNLRRLFVDLPIYYFGLAIRKPLGRQSPKARFLRQQITGSLAGIAFYLRNRSYSLPSGSNSAR